MGLTMSDPGGGKKRPGDILKGLGEGSGLAEAKGICAMGRALGQVPQGVGATGAA
jgi:hypothetical protein